MSRIVQAVKRRLPTLWLISVQSLGKDELLRPLISPALEMGTSEEGEGEDEEEAKLNFMSGAPNFAGSPREIREPRTNAGPPGAAVRRRSGTGTWPPSHFREKCP